ncbi:MAG: hypothetical protein H8D56_03170 [Planctomycetes bacterium]|nr:hypothetical protein [Planctomycetota bacterium]MBL7143683.1 hypothetical protein [Phycisphaerae bacterium]
MAPKSFMGIFFVVVGLICGAGYGEEVADLVTRLEKLDGKDSIRAMVHVGDRVSNVLDEESKPLEETDFVIAADANELTLTFAGKISNNRLFRDFSLLRAGELAHYGPHLARELDGLELVENGPEVYRGISCRHWFLKSERKESKFGISSTTLRDVELWIDAEGYPIAGSFKAQTKGRMLLFKFNSELAREQRYQRLGGRLVLVFDRDETDVKSKAGEQKRTITTTVEVRRNRLRTE